MILILKSRVNWFRKSGMV